jgi:peptidoglycan hydrolase CwlO-like protein
MVSTIKLHDNDVNMYEIINNITTENETLTAQVQDNQTSTNNVKKTQIDIQNDIRSHFLYTDVSEENSLNIQNIENEIDTLQSKMYDLQQNLSSVRYLE